MAPPILAHLSNPTSGRHLRRQALSFSHHPPGQSSASRTGKAKPRALDAASQPSVVLEGPPSPPIAPTPSESLAPEPSAIPVGDSQPHGPNQPGDIDIPGNIVAAVVVVVLILGGLIGLVVGGEMLRKRARTTGESVSPPPSRCLGRQKSKPTKNATSSPQQRTRMSPEKLPYDEKTVTPLTRPPPVLNRERQRRLIDIWPIRSFSQAPCNRRSCPDQVEHSVQHSPPVASPQTTWSDFSPASHYVAPPRIILSRIPEELEDSQSQTDIAVVLGVTLQRSPEPGSVVSIPQMKQPKSSHSIHLESLSSGTTERCDSQDCQIVRKAGTRDEDTKSLGSSAPDMTSDGGESSRSSTASLESLGDGNDRESLKEEVFELRRAQTRSMQMNKGVLLSLSLMTLDDSQNLRSTHGELVGGPSCSPPTLDAEGAKDNDVERETEYGDAWWRLQCSQPGRVSFTTFDTSNDSESCLRFLM
ncbi:hypothetical protein J3R82DRAFT_10734 [Butyriboletus roseoflavus]|nr:hypothetical protein J3R82DRAFT_10734 [Butyriboletus roseoflavus]